MSSRMPAELVIDALEMAMKRRGNLGGVIITQIRGANTQVSCLRNAVMSLVYASRWAPLEIAMTMRWLKASSRL